MVRIERRTLLKVAQNTSPSMSLSPIWGFRRTFFFIKASIFLFSAKKRLFKQKFIQFCQNYSHATRFARRSALAGKMS